jgi:hypothetical protein
MSTFDFKGQISRVDGTIDYAAMSDFVEYFYFKDENTYTNVDIRNVANEIKERFNALSEHDSAYINKALDFKELAIIFYVFDSESDLQEAVTIIDKALKTEISKKFKHSKITKPLFNTISKLIMEVQHV